MFRFRSNGMVIECLLSWTFHRLTVPLTFYARRWIESHRAARADLLGLVNSGSASPPYGACLSTRKRPSGGYNSSPVALGCRLALGD
jgi:hypothetical protein